ncbi:MAG: hypothetical protein CO186_03685 [Zetaproteobacteria bacterium CG_4_9_14_3_um_filter_49_83]|nr:MAG: hypothetical protein AUJ56_01515 [Zetaproteobacteria bacterium CG1_02_49_23]PIQ31015.1 MAG: hypothetical protein COW62_10840 [Zetaproteobacteria bacterium CG17_big_fil_post_rev_8_21_14_2_50_50_13]PIV30948.1 MAG: hypothetical protein COS35_03960 [Zetaproteobacteria bacterium CG02_land_8_20_14_3_00_50_9]PIY56900.1 MAG: hypothetical protein COZ00_01830 [Zetaproteobacteria bacterium CG_4_10_14_0_8_um_filter_49_80]PJA35843.1 MAG: hypothetical protein CO186_03685 [Zetaproteobacteria bacterium
MPLIVLSVLLQVAFIVHIAKTGRSTYWIWIVLMLPLAGSIAYFIVELLPELTPNSAKDRNKADLTRGLTWMTQNANS